MNDQPTRRFVLQFNTNFGRVVRLNIPRSVSTKTSAATRANMEAIIDNGAVSVRGRGTPSTVNSAKVITTTRETLNTGGIGGDED